MLRIAHIESSVNLGGQELRILDQIRWMGDHGHSAWLLAREDSAVFKEATRRNLPTHPISFRGSASPRAIFGLIRLKINLLDCHSASAASTALAARLLGTPIVRTLHYDFKTDLVHKYLCRYGSDHIITVSRWIADKLTKLGFAARRIISIIPTGIDLHRFNPGIDHHTIRNEFNISAKTAIISAIAMIRPDKGQKYLIRAVDRIAAVHPDTCFLIVGSATRTEFLNDIKKEIAALHNRDKVILTGFRQDIEEVIAASDVIVNSSIYEPRSQVIHQAFAMKKLVIASNAGGNKESIAHGKTGVLFRSENVESLSQTILAVLGNHTELIREQAYQTALSAHGIDTMMGRTFNIYHKILKAKQSLQSFQCRRSANEQLKPSEKGVK
ncbi:MAG: glycosyltransferase family 4 protein [Syntrophales bacterium]|jgi:glycosyltransferase involved in cell wall biosynthesis